MLPFPYRDMTASYFQFGRRTRSPLFDVNNALAFILFLATIIIAIHSPHHLLVAALTSEDDNYCGISWSDADTNCHLQCTTGEDSECRDALGAEYGCYFFTGCVDDDSSNEEAAEVHDDDVWEEDDDAAIVIASTNNNFCGTSWIDAMLRCGDPCPLGYECSDPAERCFAATNCDRPLESSIATFVCTLNGMTIAVVMDDAEATIFVRTLNEIVDEKAEELGLALAGFDIRSQVLVEGSGLDIVVAVTGEYRPPPYVNLDIFLEDTVNLNKARLVRLLRERGERAGVRFFNGVDGIEAVPERWRTSRPTYAPTIPPTMYPTTETSHLLATASPTAPTAKPVVIAPSAPPFVRGRVITTASPADLPVDSETISSSYGYLWNIRTKADSGAVLLTGFDFYTESTSDVVFELWTRTGTFRGHKGRYDGWVLIAYGTTEGRGIGRYTAIPEETYTPVSIPGFGGDDGTRAFYLTLNSEELVYKISDVPGTASDSRIHAESPDLEIWEGEGVLSYPFSDPDQDQGAYYGYPRQYLGAIYYDRLLPVASTSTASTAMVFATDDEPPSNASPAIANSSVTALVEDGDSPDSTTTFSTGISPATNATSMANSFVVENGSVTTTSSSIASPTITHDHRTNSTSTSPTALASTLNSMEAAPATSSVSSTTSALDDSVTTTYFTTNATESIPTTFGNSVTTTSTDATLMTTSDAPTVTTTSSRANATDATLTTNSDAPTAEPPTSEAFRTKYVLAFVSAGLLGGMQMI